jgi:hypothetical protein
MLLCQSQASVFHKGAAMSSRFPPLAPKLDVKPRAKITARALHALPLPVMELGLMCLFGLLLLA